MKGLCKSAFTIYLDITATTFGRYKPPQGSGKCKGNAFSIPLYKQNLLLTKVGLWECHIFNCPARKSESYLLLERKLFSYDNASVLKIDLKSFSYETYVHIYYMSLYSLKCYLCFCLELNKSIYFIQ